MTKLEDAILDVVGTKDILQEPKIYVSPTDKMFDEFMDNLGKHERGDISFSIEPTYNKKEIDGVFISFKVTL